MGSGKQSKNKFMIEGQNGFVDGQYPASCYHSWKLVDHKIFLKISKFFKFSNMLFLTSFITVLSLYGVSCGLL